MGAAIARRHYHEYNWIHHGLVHGEGTRDNHYTARVDSPWLSTNDYNRDHFRAWWHECRGIAGVDQDGHLDGHTQYAHNFYAEPCKLSNAR